MGIEYEFPISQKLAGGFLDSKFYLTRILHRSHC
jgi:hypothetical protein